LNLLAVAVFFWGWRDCKEEGDIEFVMQMPTATMMFLATAVLSLAATLVALKL
jgi:hypothetical protein